MRRFGLLLLTMSVIAAPLCAQAPATAASGKLDETPRLGVLIPVGPPDYAIWLDRLKDARIVHKGPFQYRLGTIEGVPVALNIAPSDGPLLRSLAAQEMIDAIEIKVMIYPGTSGGHLPKGEMGIGDIVLGAKNVDHGNYFLTRSGAIEAGSFNSIQPGMKHFGALYADPALLGLMACSASRVAAHTQLPAYVVPVRKDLQPQIFFYGIQGTSTIWSDNLEYTKKTMDVFHEIDEDGDWYSNLVATLYGVPFIEVSVISNSILAFPDADRGTPAAPAGVPGTHVYAQRLSNQIAVDLIGHYGAQMLKGSYTTPQTDPYAASAYDHPLEPGELLRGRDCR